MILGSCLYVFMKLNVTAQPGPDIVVFLCYSHLPLTALSVVSRLETPLPLCITGRMLPRADSEYLQLLAVMPKTRTGREHPFRTGEREVDMSSEIPTWRLLTHRQTYLGS